jgi:hypothetical protein
MAIDPLFSRGFSSIDSASLPWVPSRFARGVEVKSHLIAAQPCG